MSENGPYNQPPQNPYGGGDGTGGQPPYGPPQGHPYGDAATGGQPGYGQGPYPGAPGPDQGMYAGGQPPYGPGPGGPGGYPPAPPPQGGGSSKAGLWVVIGGGAVIIVLVIAVFVMLVTNGNDGDEIASGPDESSEVVEEEPAEEEPAEEETPASNGALGDPPHALPTEPCESFTDQVQTDFVLRDSGSKYVSDNTSSCSNLGDLPDSSSTEGFGSLEVGFKLPYSASDSPEAAAEDIEYTLDRIRGGAESDRYDADDIEIDEELDGLGSEAYLVVTKTDLLGEKLPEASLLMRQDNLIISVTYYLDTTQGDHEDLALPDNTQDIMVNAANEALAIVGG